MQAFWVITAYILISKCNQVYSDKNYSVEKVREQSVSSELVNLLNGTYFNLNEKIDQLQRKVDSIKKVADHGNRCEYNETEINEFKQAVSDELHAFSKILTEFESQLRLLQNEQAELRNLLDNADVASSTTTTTSTTPTASPTSTTPTTSTTLTSTSPTTSTSPSTSTTSTTPTSTTSTTTTTSTTPTSTTSTTTTTSTTPTTPTSSTTPTTSTTPTSTTSTTPTTSTSSTPEVCDHGWISSPTKCYYVSTISEKTDWSTAISRCTAMGAKLVEIQTDEEASLIMKNLPSRVSYQDIIYTGRKRNDKDKWVFISNDKLVDTSMRTWANDEPDGGTQRCGCITMSRSFLMSDCWCTGLDRLYICEIKHSSTTTISTTTTTSVPATPSTPKECDQGWISSPEKCYYVSTYSEKTEWSTATSRCTTMGAKLVEIQTDEEASFIMGNMPNRVSNKDIIYTGRKRNDKDKWVFISNDKLVDTSMRTWANDEPDGGTQRCGCITMSRSFLMSDCWCTGLDRLYICEIKHSSTTTISTTTTTSVPATPSTPKECDQGWISSPEKCYYVSTYSEKTEWSTATSRCTTMGAKLVEIQTDEEASFIMGNMPNRVSNKDMIYTGRKRNDRDEWVFISNDKLVDTSVRTWANGEPDGGTERCGCTAISRSFLMSDCWCTGLDRFYICEIKYSSTPTISTTTTTSVPATPSTPKVCDQGWISSPEKCYYVSTDSEKTEWATAISRCTTMGAKLVEIQTDEEASFILGNMPNRFSDQNVIYTGRKRNDRDEWVFVSNDKPVNTSVRSWAFLEPEGGSQSCGCTKMSRSFLMLDCWCTDFDRYYICEIEHSSTPVPATPSTPKVCDQGWISSPEKCYYVSTDSETTEWATAISRCTTIGAKLVEIQTDEEASFILANMPNRFSDQNVIYTGRKRNDRDEWVFVSNDKPVNTSVRSWAFLEPEGGSQSCGCTKMSRSFLMLDCWCTDFDRYYICEIER